MPREAKLRKKNGWWFSQAGSRCGVYLGRVDQVSKEDANLKLAEHLKATRARAFSGITVAELVEDFLASVKAKRGDRAFSERELHCNRWANFPRADGLMGDMQATDTRAQDWEDFKAWLGKEHELKDEYNHHKHFISINNAYNWGAGLARIKNPSPCLPMGFRPFMGIERYKAPPRALSEHELPTDEERDALFAHADDDLAQVREGGRYRAVRPEEYRTGDENPYRGFQEMLRIYWHTGARTSELCNAVVGDFQRRATPPILMLAKHKRSKTLRNPIMRQIILNDEAFRIISEQCKGKTADEPIFSQPNGKPWDHRVIDHRFRQVRERTQKVVRPFITIYSFRHRWISDALMHGVDIATVAKMAGTSVSMIEHVYGHFRAKHLAEAQARLDAGRAGLRLAS